MDRLVEVANGVLAGIVATIAMSGWMVGSKRAGLMSEAPPTRITRDVVEPLQDDHLSGARLRAATAALHLAIGGAAGGVYALLAGAPRLRGIPAVVRGVAFGTAMWALAYVGVLPATGLMPPPTQDERRRPIVMLVAHWIYGAVLAIVASRTGWRMAHRLEPRKVAGRPAPGRLRGVRSGT